MRHRVHDKKFGRSPEHRKALIASIVCGLIDSRRVTTTLPKAREARRLAEKMVTIGRKGSLAARRQAIAILRREKIVGKLFADIAPRFTDRSGGYTRIVKTGSRLGDAADMAILEWVGIEPVVRKKRPKKAETAAAPSA